MEDCIRCITRLVAPLMAGLIPKSAEEKQIALDKHSEKMKFLCATSAGV
jgi:hypothetical protein